MGHYRQRGNSSLLQSGMKAAFVGDCFGKKIIKTYTNE